MTAQQSRLRWQCRRGMRELDVLLTRYLTDEYPRESEARKAAFEQLLSLSDPELVAYLLKGERSGDPEIEGLLRKLRR